MAKLPFMRLFPKDFFADPAVDALSPEEQGIYVLLLMRMWINGAWISADDRIIARKLGMDLRRWRQVYKKKIVDLFDLETDPVLSSIYRQKRLTETWRSAMKDVRHASMMRGKKAAKAVQRPDTQERKSNATQEPPQEQAQEPYEASSEPGISHIKKEAAGAAANHQASEPVAVSSPALRSSREEAENAEPEPAPDIRRDRDDQGTLPDAKRAADVHASTGGLLGKLEAHRRAKEGKGR